jgi:hypothetical protein
MFWKTEQTKMLPRVILNQIFNQKEDSVQVGFEIIIVVTLKSATL